MEIVGIARDGRYRTLYEDRQPYLFLPVSQHPRASMALLVSAQAADAVAAVVENARGEIAGMDTRLPAFSMLLGQENLAIAYWGPSVAAGMASTFGLLALILATMGLYSVMVYSVSLGMALGTGAPKAHDFYTYVTEQISAVFLSCREKWLITPNISF
jgi:hypothetical protein